MGNVKVSGTAEANRRHPGYGQREERLAEQRGAVVPVAADQPDANIGRPIWPDIRTVERQFLDQL
jgi:hypothetical protein